MSSFLQPNISSAAGLNRVINPSFPINIIASPVALIIICNRFSLCSSVSSARLCWVISSWSFSLVFSNSCLCSLAISSKAVFFMFFLAAIVLFFVLLCFYIWLLRLLSTIPMCPLLVHNKIYRYSSIVKLSCERHSLISQPLPIIASFRGILFRFHQVLFISLLIMEIIGI